MSTSSTEQPDGFGFQPGELIPSAPYIFPGEEELCYALEFAAEFGDYIPVIGWIVALVAEIIDAILQLIDELVLVFTGKARAQDTLTVAGRLARGVNPAATLMAVQIHRNLSQNNIVLSSSDAADQKILGDIRKQGEAMLVAQGATQARATTVVDHVWTQTTSKTQPLPVELNSPLPSQLTLLGTIAQQALYVKTYNQAIQNGDDPQQAAKKATDKLLQGSKLGDLGKMRVVPMPLPVLPQPPICPAGFTWDDQLKQCVANPNSPPPPPPPPGNPAPCPPFTALPTCLPAAPGADPDQDEVGNSAIPIAYWLSIIAIYAMNLFQSITTQTSSGEPADPVTCTQLTAQVALITAQLEAITTAITNLVQPGASNPEPPPVVNVTVEPAPIVIEPGSSTPADLSHLNAAADADTAARNLTAANYVLTRSQVAADFATLATELQ